MVASSATLLGFDFGTKRIGVAVGQMLTQSTTPLPTLKAKQGQPSWPQIHSFIKTWQPEALIVGFPLNMDGTEQPITQRAKAFADALQQQTGLPVHGSEERLSTVEARQRIFDHGGYRALQKTAIDSMAACIILEAWMLKQTTNH